MSDSPANNDPANNEQAQQEQTTPSEARLEPRKVFLKDVSFESPQSPSVFTKGDVQPEIDVQMLLHHTQLDKTFYEVVLETTVTAKTGEDVLFLVEIQQGGIFEIVCDNPQQLEMLKEIACPNILLPFVRETVADLIAKGGFPQLLLNPVNFEALYARKKQKEAQSAQTPSSDSIN